MLLSKQQQYVLDVLRRLGCARETQLQALLQARFFPPDKAVPPGFLEAMLRQLRCGSVQVRRQEDVIFLPERPPDERLLEAVDVMLQLSGAAPSDFWAEGGGPVLLRFSVAGRRSHRPRRALAPRREQGRTGGGPAPGRQPPAGAAHPQHGVLRPAAERRLPPLLCPGRNLT